MRIKRWLGLVAAASVLQLNVRAAYAACEWVDLAAPVSEGVNAPHATHQESTSSARAPSGGHHHEEPSAADVASSATRDSEVPGDLPVPADCCEAMASCGSSVVVNQVETPSVGPLASAPAIAARGEILHGRIPAPEPPPPKA